VDVGALVAALVGAVGGAIAAGIGALQRSRTTKRTAARLVYAELERNSAAVAFYRAMGTWPVSTTSRTAWDSHSETLARDRQTAMFQTVSRGYAALEAVAYIAGEKKLSSQDTTRLVEENVGWLCDALRWVGKAAQIPDDQLDGTLDRLKVTSIPQAVGRRQFDNVPPSLLSQLLDLQLAAGQAPGSALEVETAQVRVEQDSFTSTSTLVGAALRVYDAAGSSERSPSRLKLVRTEAGPPSNDVTVEETFNAMAQTVRFFREVFGRDSLDETAAPTVAVVHFEKNYLNAFWDGEQLILGDGDGELFGRFSACIDVVAHELSHVLTQQAGLRYQAQSGALNESIADVFGSLVKQYTLHQSARESDWLMGAGLLTPDISGQALRSLRAPGTAYDNERLGKDPQIAHMSHYLKAKAGTFEDSTTLRLNSGIPNHAFYLLAASLGGYAWDKAGMIWYRALTSKAVTPTVTFQSFAGLTVAVARRDYAEDPSVANAVEAAWQEVGVTARLTKRALDLAATRPASE
jgi:Thermolysin metallopeptidase, alpha-helical domain/Thermolysin metallopeptidase, catalytic domain